MSRKILLDIKAGHDSEFMMPVISVMEEELDHRLIYFIAL